MGMEYDDEIDEIDEAIENAEPKNLPDEGIVFQASSSVMRAIENEVVGNICSALQQRVTREVEKKLKEIVDAAVIQAIGERALELVQAHLDKPRRKTDVWGNVIGPETSFAEIIPSAVDHYLTQTVNEKGMVSSYSGDSKTSRVNWVIGAHIKAHIDPVITKTVSDVTNLAKTAIASKVGSFIAAELTPQIDAKAIAAKVKADA